MKLNKEKLLYILSGVILSGAVLSSCVKENEADSASPVTGKDVITCTIADAADGQSADQAEGTKMSLRNRTNPIWENGDMISVMSAQENNCFSLSEGAGTIRGAFWGTLPASTSALCCLFPYQKGASYNGSALTFTTPSTQSCSAGNFSKDGNVMVAVFTKGGENPSFKNVFGILEIQLQGNANIGSLTLRSSKNDDMLWGNCTLAINGNQGTNQQSLSIAGGSNVMTMSLKNAVQLSETGSKSFYFTLPAGTLSQGFTLEIYDSKGIIIYSKTTSKAQTITRSQILQMPVIEDVDKINDDDVVPLPTTWAAYNNLGRTGTADETNIDPQTSGYPQTKQDKYVGIFYFIWHTLNSAGGGPYDVQKFLGAGNYGFSDALNYNCGGGKTHHWGEPYLGYYRDDDLWVLRKHAQMLVDAGVDFICFDTSNNDFLVAHILTLLNVWKSIRDEGGKTPQVVFMIWHSKGTEVGGALENYRNYNHDVAIQTVYNTFYAAHPEYSDLWFKWEGKPLMLAIGEHVTNANIRNYFTFRRGWYLWNGNWQTDVDAGDPWWADKGGVDCWPWGCAYTDDNTNIMKAGTHGGVNECASVSPATHPVSNIGRSFQVGNNWQSKKGVAGNPNYPKAPAKGIYFKQQFDAAMKLDPKVMFFTGWNEFLMGHFEPGALQFWYCCGVAAQNSMFVDQYNNEFSRDIEPIAGDFGDNYYYYMVDFIRQFKGVDSVPTFSKTASITIDGYFFDWIKVGSSYADDKGDIKWRGYNDNGGNNGWTAYGNTLPKYVNKTGRNDLHISKIATDGTKLYFYVSAVSDALTNYSAGETGLNLFIRTTGASAYWEGFSYRVMPTSATTATLSRYNASGSYSNSWTEVDRNIEIAVSGKAMEVAVPLSELGISGTSNLKVDFKWVDNVDLSQTDGIQRCMRDGDSAPNGRFRYRYVFNN